MVYHGVQESTILCYMGSSIFLDYVCYVTKEQWYSCVPPWYFDLMNIINVIMIQC